MLSQADFENLGVKKVGERILLLSLAKAQESMYAKLFSFREKAVRRFYSVFINCHIEILSVRPIVKLPPTHFS